MGPAGNSGCTHYSKRKACGALLMHGQIWGDSLPGHRRPWSGLDLMVVRLLAGALACRLRLLGRLMAGGRGMVIRLCLGGLGGSRLIEVVRVNFLLSVGLHQERGPSTDCDY